MRNLISLSFIIFFLSQSNLMLSQTCDCKEYLYLNEPREQAVLKFEIDPSGIPLNEISDANGSFPWFESSTSNPELPFPHGVAFGPNGSMFIGSEAAVGAPVRQFNCDGTIEPVGPTTINNVNLLTNMFSIGERYTQLDMVGLMHMIFVQVLWSVKCVIMLSLIHI